MFFNQYYNKFASVVAETKFQPKVHVRAEKVQAMLKSRNEKIVNAEPERKPKSFMGEVEIPKLCEFYGTTPMVSLYQILNLPWKLHQICDCCGETPLHFAVRLNSSELLDILKSQVEYEVTNELGQTALHVACEIGNEDMVARLLDLYANPFWMNLKGETCMTVCIKEGHTNVAEIILEKTQADLSQDDPENYYLMMATRFGSRDFVDLFLRYNASIDYIDAKGYSAAFLAVKMGHEEVLDCLIEHRVNLKHSYTEEHLSLLHAACKLNNEACVQKLLVARAPVYKVNYKQETPLHMAIQYSSLEIVRMLVSFNSDIEAMDNIGRTPLFLAILHNKPELVEYLLSVGASSETVVEPLIYRLQENDLYMVKLLVNYGLSIYQKDRFGNTLLSAAMTCGNIEIKNFVLNKNSSRGL